MVVELNSCALTIDIDTYIDRALIWLRMRWVPSIAYPSRRGTQIAVLMGGQQSIPFINTLTLTVGNLKFYVPEHSFMYVTVSC